MTALIGGNLRRPVAPGHADAAFGVGASSGLGEAPCPLARAAARAVGLDEGSYEVLLLEVLRRECPKGRPDAEAMLSDFRRDLAVLWRLSRMGAEGLPVLEHYYRRGVEASAPLIQNGAWWRAIVLERVTLRRIEKLVAEKPEEGMVQVHV